jgi:Domain of unknown function (DUF4399)
MRSAFVLFFVAFASTTAVAQQPAPTAAEPPPRSASPSGAEVYIIAPKDGETVGSDVLVRFGLKGMGVAPAGIQLANTGHHHLLIDVKELPGMDQAIAKDDTHQHFGLGQTETTIHLSAGDHTLQLLLGDWIHVPHQPPVVSKKITIHVK